MIAAPETTLLEQLIAMGEVGLLRSLCEALAHPRDARSRDSQDTVIRQGATTDRRKDRLFNRFNQ
jgi:hypothetical protein